MIEEAAGTRMFETKKQAALKTIEKKQQKVDEITRIIEADIDPKLTQLRSERQNYLDWSSNNTELERLERFCLAAEYKMAEERVNSAEGEKAALVSDLKRLKDLQEQLEAEAAECTTRIEQLESEKEGSQDGAGGLQELKRVEQELSKELVKANAAWSNQKDSLASEKENLTSIQRQIEQTIASVAEKQSELRALTQKAAEAEAAVAEGERNLQSVREAYQNACAGKAEAANAELLSLPEQIATWEKAAREAQSALQQGVIRVAHATEQLKDLKKSVKSQQAAHSGMLREIEGLRSHVTAVEGKIARLGYSRGEEEQCRAMHAALQAAVASLRDRSDELTAQLEARLNFEFSSPEKGFDRRRVKGVVAKLVRVSNPRHATALEIVAGGKLFNVVVDTEQTGKALLQHGKLKKRVTILPLNKINNKCVDPAKVALAKNIAAEHGGSASLALELIGFDEEVRRGMEFVFGNAIICDNQEIAKLIAFDRSIRTRTVTLDGDSYDPSGTVTGGSNNQLGTLLARVSELAEALSALDNQGRQLAEVEKRLTKLEADAQSFERLSAELDSKRRALANGEERLAATTFSVMTSEIEGLEAEIKRCQEVSCSNCIAFPLIFNIPIMFILIIIINNYYYLVWMRHRRRRPCARPRQTPMRSCRSLLRPTATSRRGASRRWRTCSSRCPARRRPSLT